MLASTTAKIFGVPSETLTVGIHGRVTGNSYLGTPNLLSQEKEMSLCYYFDYMAGRGFPLTITQDTDISIYMSTCGKKYMAVNVQDTSDEEETS